MQKESKLFIALLQIVLLVTLSFTVSFLLGENLASAQEKPNMNLPVRVPSTETLTLKDSVTIGADVGEGFEDFQFSKVTKTGDSFVASGEGVATGTPGEVTLTSEQVQSLKESGNLGVGKTAPTGNPAAGNSFDLLGTSLSGAPAHLLNGLVWGGMIAGVIFMLGAFGVLDKDLANSLALSTFSGVMAWQGTHAISAATSATGTSTAGLLAPAIGIGVGVAVFIMTYKKEKKELVRFECFAWEAPTGGQYCETCNDNPLVPCSEYRCKSLGQACALVNPGSEEEMCVWIHPDDTTSPRIEVWEKALKPGELEYVPLDAARPGMRGVKIVKRGTTGGCLQAFTKLEFGVLTDEPAQCRLDLEFDSEFDDMNFFFGETNLLLEEHTQRMRIPDPFNEVDGEAPVIHNDGTYTLYAKCQDANGNSNEDVFAIEYCVQKGPDTTAPFIEGTSVEENSPVRFDVDLFPIEIYVNEPATCKWSWDDKAFSIMENDMTCANEIYQINANLDYVCSGNLNGILNRQNNDFFFRCVDRFNNEMLTSTSLVLRGTEPLVINNVGPNGTFTGSGQNYVEIGLSVETAHGANEGAASCYIASNAEFSDLVIMENTGTPVHSQVLNRPAGSYTYYFRCIDAGGNRAEQSTTFTVEIDNTTPLISRILKDGTNLKVITSEEAKCAYSLTDCNFNLEEAGSTALTYEDATERNVHVIPWDIDNTYHIKCEDLQGNQPFPDQCQLIVQGSDF